MGAVWAAVADSLASATTEGVAAQAVTGPLLTRLAGVAEQVGQADAALRGAVAWASWRQRGQGERREAPPRYCQRDHSSRH